METIRNAERTSITPTGTIPVTRTTGGLVDTVKVYNPETGEGNGFQFQDYDANGLIWAINEGLKVYADKAQWNKVVHNAIETRFSWVFE